MLTKQVKSNNEINLEDRKFEDSSNSELEKKTNENDEKLECFYPVNFMGIGRMCEE